MRRRTILIALLAILIPLLNLPAAAQETPGGGLTWRTAAQPVPGTLSVPLPESVPTYCQPCLEYAGDFDVNNPDSNGLNNGCTLAYHCTGLSSSNVAFAPFTVPAGQQWEVSGLFTNNISNVTLIDPAEATWSISIRLKAGYGGRILYQGKSPASFTLTGVGAPLVNVYNVLVKNIKTSTGEPIVLRPGTYWLAVVPQCTNTADPSCASAEYYLADVEDMPPMNQYGPPEPQDDSFFSSSYFGEKFQPTWGSSGVCGGVGCDAFSIGVLGTIKADDSGPPAK